ncbi:MAG TPA: hypothetical protein VFI54_26535 [Solirubrobacteraceae bacterium]|nr:hypothetical protein [Solirubrobacteraceae bacterium]
MGRPSRRPRLARPAALALLAFALALAVAAPAQAGWQAPFRVAGPYSIDVLPIQMAFSAGGQTALGYDVFNEDRALTSQGYAAISGKNGRPGSPVRVPDTQEVLDLAFDGSDLNLLIGTSPALRPCCSSARLVKIAGGKLQRPRLIFPRLTGATVGRLISLPGSRLLSSVATAQAVWTELTDDKGHPAPARLLTPKTAAPQTLGATVLRGNRTVLAWTAAAGPPAPSTAGPTGIMVADGTATRAPRGPHLAVKVPTGHQIDELAVGGGSSQGTVAWIESWNDSAGALHSEPVVSDLGRRIHARTFELPGLIASGLSFATDPSGAQVLAWKACDLAGSCRVETVAKDAGGRFSDPISLGRIDPAATLAAAVSAKGVGLVGWISGGRVLAAARGRRARRFGPTRVVSRTTSAMDLTLGFGASGALAAWSEGTFTETVMGALFKP